MAERSNAPSGPARRKAGGLQRVASWRIPTPRPSPGAKDEVLFAPIRCDDEWRHLAKKFGFLPGWKGLAVVELWDASEGSDLPEKAGDRVLQVKTELARARHPFAVVAFATTRITAALIAEVTNAGGVVLKVEDAFRKLPAPERTKTVAMLLPDPRRSRPANPVQDPRPKKEPPFDETSYRGPVGRYSKAEVDAWAAHVSAPVGPPSEVD